MLNTDWNQLHPRVFSKQRVLITGGAGFIGSHLTHALLTLGANVVVLDDLSGSDLTNITPLQKQFGKQLEFHQGSILDHNQLEVCMKNCRWVFHEAALGSVPRSVELPELYFNVNATGTLQVLEAARAAKVQRVMFAASSSAYGDSPQLPKTESMPVLPKSPYAASKVASEALLRAYADSYGLDTLSLRYFNVFGPHQNANSAYAAVIAAFAKAIFAGKAPVIYGDGSQSRDFTFVHNVVHANLLGARATQPMHGQVINIACGQRVTVLELAQKMIQSLGTANLKPHFEPERAGDVKHSLADLALSNQVLGFQPIVDFDTGLQATTQWYRNIYQTQI